MRRLAWLGPLALFLALAGILGFRAGAPPSETEIINRYVEVYLQTAPEGAMATDCAARPHPDDRIRLVVVCVHSGGARFEYPVDNRGWLRSLPDVPTA